MNTQNRRRVAVLANGHKVAVQGVKYAEGVLLGIILYDGSFIARGNVSQIAWR